MPPVACFICGAPARLASEKKTHVDFDCATCGRLRVTGRAMFVFTPPAMRCFDRAWLSARVLAIAETPRDGGRRLVTELWLHHRRLITLLMLDHAITEPEAEDRLACYPGADVTDGTVLALVARDLGRT